MTYKSSIFVMIKNVIYGIFGGAVAAFIANWFLDIYISIAIGAFLGLLIIYFALIGDNIKIVVDGDSFSVYRRGKLKHTFNINEVGLYANIKTVDGDSDCKLTVIQADDNRTYIDCTMLGRNRFYKLLDTLHVTDPEPVAIETQIKK